MSTPEILKRRIVGVVGGAASGKDSVAREFVKFGYEHVSSSDSVREEIARRGLTPSRALQTQIANELRLENGYGHFVDLAVDKASPSAKKIVISGLYAIGEGKHLQEAYGGCLVAVVTGNDNDASRRFTRLTARSDGPRDDITLPEFEAAEERENSGHLDHEPNLGVLISMSRFVIYNTATVTHLQEQTQGVITQLIGGVA